MKTVAVVGVGLIGASFGLAIRRAGFAGRIIGVSSREAVEAGLAIGAISEAASLEHAAEAADLIYLAQPVDRILQTLEFLSPLVRPGCLITDAGSTKSLIVTKAANCLPEGSFLGGHPMAGKEQSGAEAAEETLFRNRPYVLTPTTGMTPQMGEFRQWLERLQTRVVVMSAAQHDKTVALTSHLPQLLSTSLALTLAEQHAARISEVFGPGLIDMTRLAMSSPEIWESVLGTNRAEVLRALDQFTERLESVKARLKSETPLGDLLNKGRTFIVELRAKGI